MQPHHGVSHYENFPVASWLCPASLRPAVVAIYGFARTADDLADEGPASPAERLADLAAFRADLQACAQGQASERWPQVFRPLGPVLRQFQLPLPLLEDLLSAFEQDVLTHRYTSQAQLLDYCRRSANPVGRLLLHLYGVQDATSLRQSDCICTALQLVNFWQDLSVDLPRGRLYLPADMLAGHGLQPEQLLQQESSAAALALVAQAVAWVRALMRQGAPLVHSVPGRAGWELRLVVQGGLRIAQRIEAMGYDTLRQRPKLGRRDVAAMVWGSCWM
jgi:squalene synthase HpnC